MNNTKQSKDHGIFSDPGRIAPNIDKQWRDEFIFELRMLDVPGDKIGDHLMTIDTHVAESGEHAQDAFGDPRTYARDLAAGAGGSRGKLSLLFIVGNVIGLLGLYLTLWAFGSWLDGSPAEILVGTVVSAGVLVALLILVTTFFGPIVRFVSERGVLGILLFFGLGALVGVPVVFLRQPLFEVAPWLLGVVGIALLVISSVISHRETSGDHDEITAPGMPARRSHAGIITALMLPLATLVGMVLVWIPTLFT